MQAFPSNGMGTASLVLGILADISCLAWPLALVLGVLAVIFGALGRGRPSGARPRIPGWPWPSSAARRASSWC
ncbi:hypothetical protein ACFQ3Z_32810 [Streptomyces nogalater]